MDIKPKDKAFTFPSLAALTDLLIGDADCAVLPAKYKSLAELLEVAARDTFILAIQWEDQLGNPLSCPVIWRWRKWMDSIDKWKMQKEKSERERIERFIFAHNVKLVTKACMKYFELDEKFGEAMAFSAVKNNKNGLIKEVGVILITKEEEL